MPEELTRAEVENILLKEKVKTTEIRLQFVLLAFAFFGVILPLIFAGYSTNRIDNTIKRIDKTIDSLRNDNKEARQNLMTFRNGIEDRQSENKKDIDFELDRTPDIIKKSINIESVQMLRILLDSSDTLIRNKFQTLKNQLTSDHAKFNKDFLSRHLKLKADYEKFEKDIAESQVVWIHSTSNKFNEVIPPEYPNLAFRFKNISRGKTIEDFRVYFRDENRESDLKKKFVPGKSLLDSKYEFQLVIIGNGEDDHDVAGFLVKKRGYK